MIASPTIPSVYFVQIPDKKTQLKEVHSWRCWEDSWVSEDDLKYAGEVVYLCVLNIAACVVLTHDSWLPPEGMIQESEAKLEAYLSKVNLETDITSLLSCSIGQPGRSGSVVEHRPMNQEITVQFLVRAHAQVLGLIPSVGHVRSSQSMIIFQH